MMYQDTADGEFSCVKTRLAMHLVRHPEEQVGFVGVLDSASFTKFGNQQMSKPGDRSRLASREFFEIKPNVVKERKEMVGEKVRTLSGIKSKYEYVCCPNGKVGAVYPCSVTCILSRLCGGAIHAAALPASI